MNVTTEEMRFPWDNRPLRYFPARHNVGERDPWLDWLRGLAAIAVLVGHVRGGYFVKWSDLAPESQHAVNWLLFVLTRLGREAVVVFFVLSGYLVGGKSVEDFLSNRFSAPRYFVARLARLWAVVIPAVVLTLVVDLIRNTASLEANGVSAALRNIFFLQTVTGPVYGSNVPFWSLASEWWFYAVFGLSLSAFAAYRFRKHIIAVASLVAALVCLVVMWPHILVTLPLWLAGILARALPVAVRGRIVSCGCIFIWCASIAVSSRLTNLFGDYLVAGGTVLLVLTIAGRPGNHSRWFATGGALAAVSFSLYAIHFPLSRLALQFWVPKRLIYAGPIQWLGCLTIIAILFACAVVFWWLFERHSPRLRRTANRLLALK